MSKHSPGPWRVEPGHREGHLRIVGGAGADIADVFAGPNTARLIATAPRLLKELKAVYMATMEYIDREGSCPEVDLVGIEALIREIEGEE